MVAQESEWIAKKPKMFKPEPACDIDIDMGSDIFSQPTLTEIAERIAALRRTPARTSQTQTDPHHTDAQTKSHTQTDPHHTDAQTKSLKFDLFYSPIDLLDLDGTFSTPKKLRRAHL